jgi:ParB family chromosome partitioning protein
MMSDKKPVTKKKASARGLGRGLSALMADISVPEDAPKPAKATSKTSAKPKTKSSKAKKPTTETDVETRGVRFLPVHALAANPEQPRKIFDKALLAELTESIRRQGVLQPILVRPVPERLKSKDVPAYQIVAGERRWQASLKAGLDMMPVLIRDLSDREILEIGVVENVQRADLNPVEEARAYQALKDKFDRRQEDIADAVGKSRSHVANMLRLLNLPKGARKALERGKISTGHARALLGADDPDALLNWVVDQDLSVRATEDYVRRLKREGQTNVPPKSKNYKTPDIIQAEQLLTDVLGLSVDLKHKGPGGALQIKYKTGAQLEDLMRKLKS